MRMKGKDLFDLAKGATFLLNPYSDYGKELIPDEIEKMLSGDIFSPSRTITVEKKTEVQIGQPAKYPAEIVNALKQLFSNRPQIKTGYLGWIYDPASGQPPHYIFALDGDGDINNVTNEAGFTARQFLGQDEFVDFIKIDSNGGISDYFLKQTEPFYKR